MHQGSRQASLQPTTQAAAAPDRRHTTYGLNGASAGLLPSIRMWYRSGYQKAHAICLCRRDWRDYWPRRFISASERRVIPLARAMTWRYRAATGASRTFCFRGGSIIGRGAYFGALASWTLIHESNPARSWMRRVRNERPAWRWGPSFSSRPSAIVPYAMVCWQDATGYRACVSSLRPGVRGGPTT